MDNDSASQQNTRLAQLNMLYESQLQAMSPDPQGASAPQAAL